MDVRRLEILRVLDVVEGSAEGLEAIGVVRKLLSTSCVDDVSRIHPWGNGCLRLPDPLDSFDFAAPAVVDDYGLREYGLPEV